MCPLGPQGLLLRIPNEHVTRRGPQRAATGLVITQSACLGNTAGHRLLLGPRHWQLSWHRILLRSTGPWHEKEVGSRQTSSGVHFLPAQESGRQDNVAQRKSLADIQAPGPRPIPQSGKKGDPSKVQTWPKANELNAKRQDP